MNTHSISNIGILGGTLDPIHIGHTIIAQAALNELNLDKILFMPSGNPPHKDINNITSNFHRKNMVELAIKSNDKFVFSDFEMKRTGIIYTSDTLKLLREHTNDNLFFIMGADSLLAIESWHNPDKIFRYCTVLVADRDYQYMQIKEHIAKLQAKYMARIEFVKSPVIGISSSDIRNLVYKNKSIKYLVDDKVERYIIDNRLYKNV